MQLLIPILFLLTTFSEVGSADTKTDTSTNEYEEYVVPFFNKYCGKCHLGDKPKGEFGVDRQKLPNEFSNPAYTAKWREVVNVLNSHEMPPEKSPQPNITELGRVVDWITNETVRAEIGKRSRSPVLRRLNREEYRNTIRDLLGIDFETDGFPQDGQAGGFDNNGSALTMSPLQVEQYLAAAQKILDQAIVQGPQPRKIKWRFQPQVGPMDKRRVTYDPVYANNIIVNGNNNKQENDWVVVHHPSWDNYLDARGFQVPSPGIYKIRIHAAGRVPTRDQVVASADQYLTKRRDENIAKNPKSAKYFEDEYRAHLKHFQTDRMYDYGPPRIKLNVKLGSQPRTISEFDVTASLENPRIFEFNSRISSETVGIKIEYAYDVPRTLENFWFQTKDGFARPELLVDWFEIEGPFNDSWPPSTHTRLLNKNSDPREELASAKEVIGKFLHRAYRRPVTSAEIEDKWLSLYVPTRKSNKAYFEAIKIPLLAILNSPNFLYLTEPHEESYNSKPASLTNYEIASRLSYFLWSSMPDDELFKLADSGQLRNPQTLQSQVDRMLADKKANALVTNFTGQWLGLRDVGSNPPVPSLYPRYDRHLEISLIRESEAFFAEFLKSDLDIRKMIKSDFVIINERLARFYNISGVKGDDFSKVSVPENSKRGGIVTQGSILTITSNGTRTSPVKRGNWILKTLLGIDPGLPVSNAGEIAPKVPGIDKATVRQRLEIHRTLAQCARCHNKIDPLGFALENFDASGEYREQEGFGWNGRIQPNDPRIDASASMPDGTKIKGVEGLQEAILAQEDQFLKCLASKLMTYAYGRELGLADQPTVKKIVSEIKTDGYTLRSLIKKIVLSEPFSTK